MSEQRAAQRVICLERPYSMRSGRTPGTIEILFKGEVVAETTFRPKWAKETVDAINRAYKTGYEQCFDDIAKAERDECDRCGHPLHGIYCTNPECTYHEQNKCPKCGNPGWLDDETGMLHCACVCESGECHCNCCGNVYDPPPTKDEIIQYLAMEVSSWQSTEFHEQTEEEIIESAKERITEIRKRAREIKNSGFPPYARLFNSALCHKGKGVYYRHAGMWEVEAKLEDGRLVVTTSDGPMKHAEGEEMIECTAEEWEEENTGYIQH